MPNPGIPGFFRDGIYPYFQSRDCSEISPGFLFLLRALVKSNNFHQSLTSIFYIIIFTTTPTRCFQNECSKYEKVFPDAPLDIDQLNWWKNHQEALPLLAFLVRVVFAIPVASSKSERVFSVAGNVVTPKRASLTPEKVESCVIVKTNASLLRDMGLRK